MPFVVVVLFFFVLVALLAQLLRFFLLFFNRKVVGKAGASWTPSPPAQIGVLSVFCFARRTNQMRSLRNLLVSERAPVGIPDDVYQAIAGGRKTLSYVCIFYVRYIKGFSLPVGWSPATLV